WSGWRSGPGRVASRGPPFRALGVLCTPFAAGALLLRVVGCGVACAGFVGAPAPGAKGGVWGVLGTPFAAGALLLRVVRCWVGLRWLCRGLRSGPWGVLCTPFAAGALLLGFGGGFAVVVATTAG